MTIKAFLHRTIMAAASLYIVGSISAQTTLSGDHVVDGDLTVGTTANRSNLAVVGETGNTATPGLQVTGDGGVLFTGTLGQGAMPATGNGTRFMWYPGKGALRAGVMNSENINSIGIGSIAFSGSSASGINSTAMNSGRANGSYSIAMSEGATNAESSTAMSGATTYEPYSVAMAGGITWAPYAVASGFSLAEGYSSTAMSGGHTTGVFATALGSGAVAHAYNSVVIGQNNSVTGLENNSLWIPSDTLFVIGNGSGVPTDPLDVRYRNALTVYKNGKIEVSGDMILTKRQGDILMGEFGNPE